MLSQTVSKFFGCGVSFRLSDVHPDAGKNGRYGNMLNIPLPILDDPIDDGHK